jgi:hypothetical protein
MAFCKSCGAQMYDNAAVCPSCGQAQVQGSPAYNAAPAAPAGAAPGFLSSLFDLSFTSFITTKLIKVLYVLGMVCSAFMALSFIITGLTQGGMVGLPMVILGPIVFLAFLIYWRVVMEMIILFFRAVEYLGELVRQGRRAGAAGAS